MSQDTPKPGTVLWINGQILNDAPLLAVVMDTGAASTSSSSASTTNTRSIQPQVDAGVPGGGNPASDMGAGMPASTGAQSAGQTQTGTTQTVSSQSSGATNQVSTVLINALVQLLQKKIA